MLSPGGLIYGSSKLLCPESKRCVGLSASQYYTLWHKSYKMNNKFKFILGITGFIEIVCKTCWNNLKKVPACGRSRGFLPLPQSAFDRSPPSLCGRPLLTAP